MNARWLSTTLAALSATSPLLTQAVSPLGRDRFEGSSSTSYPLGRHDARVMTLHADLGASARTLSGHAYRRDAIAQRGVIPGFTADLEVVMSIAARAPDQASSTFAQNVGANPVTVLPRTSISFPATGRPPFDPAGSFEHSIPYATPFALPASAAAVCLDVRVHGNQTANGPDRNFSPYLDAHELFRDGHSEQPGYRFDIGCAAVGVRRTHTGRLTLLATQSGLDLEIDSRDGVPSGLTALIVGSSPLNTPWSFKPECRLLASLDTVVGLPGLADANGDWSGTLRGIGAPLSGTNFWTQVVTGVIGGDGTFSDGSLLTVPPAPSPQVLAARVAHGSDRTSPTGTVSLVVPVTQFF